MKKIILIFVIALAFTACKKSNKMSANSTASTPDIYCIWLTHGTSPKTFYKCVETQEEMQAEAIKIRDSNQFSEITRKATCSECN